MRLLPFALASLVGSAGAADDSASLYLFDTKPQQPHNVPLDIPLKTLEILLSRRIDLVQGSRLDIVDGALLQQINQYGGEGLPILNDDETLDSSRHVIIVEGVEDSAAIFPDSAGLPAALSSLEGSPARAVADYLSSAPLDIAEWDPERCTYVVDNLVIQGTITVSKPPTKPCPSQQDVIGAERPEKDNTASEYLESILHQATTSRGATVKFRIRWLQYTAMKYGLVSDEYHKAVKDLSKIFLGAREKFGSQIRENAILLLPIASDSSAFHLQQRTKAKESPPPNVDIGSTQGSSEHKSPKRSGLSTSMRMDQATCFSSLLSCMSETANCTGHGECTRRLSSGEGDTSSVECYTCSCIPTVRLNEGGTTKKTTSWVGSACSRKDVSMPFFLLAGVTVAMIAAVSWAVGLLFDIDSTPLPSVIGAGVLGPRPQK